MKERMHERGTRMGKHNTHSTKTIHTPAGLWQSKPRRTWFFHSSFFLSAVVHIYLIKLCIGRLTVSCGDLIVTHNVHTDGFPAVN